jgi:acyl-CoA dehydrogenase
MPASTIASVADAAATTGTDWVAVACRLGPGFASRAPAYDANDSFVADNYRELKEHRVFSAGVPAELGGGGATHAELCAMLRELARHCGSTALALAMHTHQVAIPAWRWRHQQAPVEALLRRVAAEEIVLVSSGGSDWLASSGKARPVEGGYRVNARKIFASGSPAGTLLMTSAVDPHAADGPTVLHFAVPLDAEGVKVLDNWRTLAMRATGSHDVLLEEVFVPDSAISLRRPSGKWGPLFDLICMIALPLIYAVYVGVAEAARDRALEAASRKRDDSDVQTLAGEMENELTAARLALESMIAIAAAARPGLETSDAILIRRTLAARAAIRTVEKAMEVAGGGSLFRSLGLERHFRDVQGARFHPLQEKPQLRFSGRFALGLDPVA